MWARSKRVTHASIAAIFLALPACGQAGPQVLPPDSTPSANSPPASLPTSLIAVDTRTISDRLAQWLRLTSDTPDIPAQDYADFLQQTPIWPEHGLMLARLGHALAERSDDATLARLCPTLKLSYGPALVACARVQGAQTLGPAARTLWIAGVDHPDEELGFVAVFGRYLTANDQWRRFQRQITAGNIASAGRQIIRLSPDRQPLARALLAWRARSDDAQRLQSLLPTDQQSDPQLVQYRLHAMRRAGDLDATLVLWHSTGLAFQAAQPSIAWSSERASFARALMLAGRTDDAAELAADTTLPAQSPARLDADFLTGFLALQMRHDSVTASANFAPLIQSPSLITRTRGLYWLGRAKAASGDRTGAKAVWAQAALMPTTFYGQLSLAALRGAGLSGLVIPADLLAPALASLPSPMTSPASRPDLIVAAQALVQQGDIPHARIFMMMAQSRAQGIAELAGIAETSLRLGLDTPAIYAARSTGRMGVALYPAGWPNDLAIPASDLQPGLTPAVIRQESSFDPSVASGANAIGLLQLRPASAADVVRQVHLSGYGTTASALRDPQTNLAIGQAFLTQLQTRYAGVIPYMLAAYNAGPHRADSWILPDAPTDPNTLIDWIERVPYDETRNYIERILESCAIYQARASGHAG